MQPGEFGYIEWIREQQRRAAGSMLPAAAAWVQVGPGDDCAVVRSPDGTDEWVLTTDMLLQGTHFDLATCTADAVGQKLLAVSVSDVAAMGGIPMFALTSVGFAHAPDDALKEQLYRGLERAAAVHGVMLVGGDVTAFAAARADAPLVLSLSLIGRMDGVQPVLRSGAQPGDLLYVTGTLGGSLLSGRHLSFTPRVAQGRWLATRGLAAAMLDVSDGLAGDVAHIAEMSHVGVILEAARIPVSAAAHNASATDGRPAVLHALTDGEDFELAFAVRPDRADELERDWPFAPDVPISQVGRMTADVAQRALQLEDGTLGPWPDASFDHLRG